MTLRNLSILFIVLLGINFIAIYDSGGDGSWGIPLSVLTFLGILILYGLFWIGGNLKYWGGYDKPDRKLVGWLLNLPALLFFISLIAMSINRHPGYVSFTLHTLNEQGNPVTDVEIHLSPGQGKQKLVTDLKGQVEWKGRWTGNSYWIETRHPAYYNVSGYVTLEGKREGTWPFRRFKPWNPLKPITLKAIKSPIPLYVKNINSMEGNHLLSGHEYGFDLLEGDWLPPIGAGKNADFRFQITEPLKDGEDGRFILRTSGAQNGFLKHETPKKIHSQLKLPRHAPSTGYQPSTELRFDEDYFPRLHTEQERIRIENHFFRIRGDEYSPPRYGKIMGPIRLYYEERHKKWKLNLHYYLNPTPGDSNLEFDPKQNLFKGEDPYKGVTSHRSR